MPKPTKKRLVTRSVVFDRDVLKACLGQSKKDGRSLSSWVNRALAQHLNQTAA